MVSLNFENILLAIFLSTQLVVLGKHFEKELEPEDTPDQIQLMRTQDLKYIVNKRTQEQRKIEKLQATLHLTSVEHNIRNKHIHFEKNNSTVEGEQLKRLAKIKLPDVEPEILEVSSFS